jgi:hypothetical protein
VYVCMRQQQHPWWQVAHGSGSKGTSNRVSCEGVASLRHTYGTALWFLVVAGSFLAAAVGHIIYAPSRSTGVAVSSCCCCCRTNSLLTHALGIPSVDPPPSPPGLPGTLLLLSSLVCCCSCQCVPGGCWRGQTTSATLQQRYVVVEGGDGSGRQQRRASVVDVTERGGERWCCWGIRLEECSSIGMCDSI